MASTDWWQFTPNLLYLFITSLLNTSTLIISIVRSKNLSYIDIYVYIRGLERKECGNNRRQPINIIARRFSQSFCGRVLAFFPVNFHCNDLFHRKSIECANDRELH